MKNIALLLVFFQLALVSFASEPDPREIFIPQCEEYLRNGDYEIRALLWTRKRKNCSQLADLIAGAKSFNEFIPPRFAYEDNYKEAHRTWMNAFPEFIGTRYKDDLMNYISGSNLPNTAFGTMFTDLSRYKMFKNLTILDAVRLRHDNLCHALRSVDGQIETLIAGKKELQTLVNCPEQVKNLVLTDYDHSEITNFFNDKIIGYEEGNRIDFRAYPLRNLRFLHLKYVNIGIPYEGYKYNFNLGYLFYLPNLTHLSILSEKTLPSLRDLTDIKSLMYIRISCVKNLRIQVLEQLDGICVGDLTWLKELPWLKEVDLSYAGLESLSNIDFPPSVEKVNLSHNNFKVPLDLSRFSKRIQFIVDQEKQE